MQRIMKIALVALVGLPGTASAQTSARSTAGADTASAWTAPEGTYLLSSGGRGITVRVSRSEAGLAATLQKTDDQNVVTALSVSVNGPELVIKFQPGESLLTMTLRRSGAKISAVLEGEGERFDLEGSKNG